MGDMIHIREVWYILKKRKKLLIIVPLFFTVVGLLVSIYLIPPVYEAQAELLVNQTTVSEDDAPATTDVDMNLRLIDTYQSIVGSSKVREQVYEKLDGDYTLEYLQKVLDIETNEDNQIISLNVQSSTPESASKIANTYAKVSKQNILDLMDMENVRTMTKANADHINRPIRPRPVLNTIISFLGGTIFALIYIALSAYFNTKIHTDYDVKKYLGVPLLGTFGMLEKQRVAKKKNVYPLDIIKQATHTNVHEASMEAFRHLRVNIQFQKSVKKLDSILVTSADKDEGKTTTAGNLALAMALDNKKTLLINADLRKLLRLDHDEKTDSAGLTNYLSGMSDHDEIIQDLQVSNLWLMPSGPLPPNPTELLSSLLMDKLLLEMEKRFDVIIIDTSPMIFPDAAVLASKVDGCVFINHTGTTKVSHAQKAMNQLKRVNATMLGAILNNKKEKEKSSHYYYYNNG